MPVEFLSDREVAAYGRYTEAPSPAELDRWFFLDDAGKALVWHRRGDHHRLGFVILSPQVSVHDVHDLG